MHLKKILFAFTLLFPVLGLAEDSLSILSMNVYMLPKPIKWSLQSDRTLSLAEQLKDSSYDLIFFQEAFQADFRDQMARKLKAPYPYTYYLDQAGGLLDIFGSGVFVLSRYPLRVLDHLYFRECAGFDCFASKGSVLVETTLPSGKTYQFSSTHLQAGPENSRLRLQQLTEIRDMLKRHRQKQVPQLLIGDLNIDFAAPDYTEALNLLHMRYSPLSGEIRTTNARTNDCYDTPTKKMWIDHVWIDRDTATVEQDLKVKDLSFKLGGKTCPGSDHHAVEAHFRFNAPAHIPLMKEGPHEP